MTARGAVSRHSVPAFFDPDGAEGNDDGGDENDGGK